MAYEYLIPYMDHFGMPYHILDIAKSNLPEDASGDALIIFGHPGIDTDINKNQLVHFIHSAMQEGTGIVTFDPFVSLDGKESRRHTDEIRKITFRTIQNFITSSHSEFDTLKFYNPINITFPDNFDGITLVGDSGNPLLIIEKKDTANLVVWTSMDWMNSDFFGPVRGLDDCLWKSFVWAARKPFLMHSLPPVVSMRVDDVAGRGGLWHKSPLYWVKTANTYGLKPWLGLFIYNLNPQAIDELRSYLIKDQAVAFPHAFGRPNRAGNRMESYTSVNPLDTVPFYYWPDALPLRADSYDEFIYYNHNHSMPWSDQEAVRGLNAVQDWYDAHQPMPVSSCLIPHWYEMGTNCAAFVREKWGADISGFPKPPDKPYADSVQWLIAGPFRLNEKAGSCTGWTRPGGQRPVYYADFMKIGNINFFNSLTEIRDDAGYEWAPDNDVEATVGRGVRQLERAMNSLVPAVLFTHETDYIYRIEPENWDLELKRISEEIAEYQPRYLLLDDALKLVRTYHTARPISTSFNTKNGNFKIHFEGYSDVSSSVTYFIGNKDNITTEYLTIKPFKKDQVIKFKILTNFRN